LGHANALAGNPAAAEHAIEEVRNQTHRFVDPQIDALRRDPRFTALRHKMGL
jgi:hypothetical protein